MGESTTMPSARESRSSSTPPNRRELWKDGLAKWGQDGDRIRRLREAAEFAVYTPGSTAGLPVSILKSFASPGPAIVEDRELLRERVNATVTACWR